MEKSNSDDLSKNLPLIENQLNLAQKNMYKYDNYTQSIKNWTVTLWAATISGGSIKEIEINPPWALFAISIIIVLAMRIYDGMYKTYRTNYKNMRNEIAEQINKNNFRLDYIKFPEEPKRKLLIKEAIKSFFLPHVNIVYTLLIIISLIMLSFSFNAQQLSENV